MANYLKINKKPGWVVSLLLKAYVYFFRFSNFDFGSLLYIGVTAISAPQNTLRSLLFRDSNHVSPAYFIVKSTTPATLKSKPSEMPLFWRLNPSNDELHI